MLRASFGIATHRRAHIIHTRHNHLQYRTTFFAYAQTECSKHTQTMDTTNPTNESRQ
jgi:hypothetical protein